MPIMKVIIQIPCLNEEETLPLVFEKMPKKIPGVDVLEYLIIDDGSTDRTVEVARELGVHHIVRHRRNMGLARSFRDGVYFALEQGADIVVNTDGDNQYPQEMIPELIRPILDGEAEIVVADRQTHLIEHFSPLKKFLQRVGSRIVNKAAGTDLPDAASGFRAYSKQALFQLNIITQFSYCMETIIQAGNKRIAITSIPVRTNPKTRESRLFKNMWEHIFKSMSAIVRAYIMYKPRVVFATLSLLFLVLGLLPFVRFLYLELSGDQGSHIQSLLLGAVLLIASFLSVAMGVIADLIHINRILIEEELEHVKAQRFGGSR
jgi:glycosyltransferase involved in cell wall biosynthesis